MKGTMRQRSAGTWEITINLGRDATVSDRFSALHRSWDCASRPCGYCPLRSSHCFRPKTDAKSG